MTTISVTVEVTVTFLPRELLLNERIVGFFDCNRDSSHKLCLLHSEAIASVQKVVELRDTSESERIALGAAQWLAEQAYGKAVQKIESRVTHSNASPAEELESIEQQLAAIRAARSAPVALPPQRDEVPSSVVLISDAASEQSEPIEPAQADNHNK